MIKKFIVTFLIIFYVKPVFPQEKQAFFVRATGNEPSLIEGADFTKLAEYASSAMVDIETESENKVFLTDPFFQSFFYGFNFQEQQDFRKVIKSSGSGVIISPDGILISCAHVVDQTQKVIANLSDGRQYEAKTLAVYPKIDLAILKLVGPGSAPLKNLPYLKLGLSQTIRNGQPVAALGNSFSLGQNFTNGIVSAKNRRLGFHLDRSSPIVIQHNAAVNPGNSGGALVDNRGNLIGINNAIYSKSGGYNGIGFAIPIDIIGLFLNKYFSKTGDVSFGLVHLVSPGDADMSKTESFTKISPKKYGAQVLEIEPQSPAFLVGLKKNDIVLAIDEM